MDGFEQRLSGRFENMLSWEQLDALWAKVQASNAQWYLYEVGTGVPKTSLNGQGLNGELECLDKILRENHDYDYCGIVYADNPQAPTLIKIYGPKNLGASCGSGGSKVWPRWVLSHMQPSAVGVERNKKGKPKWWQGFVFKRGG